MPKELHISSLVVHCRKERAAEVAAALAGMKGLEMHGGVAEGKLVITLETATQDAIVERLNAIQILPGVLAATLVFHQFEPASVEPNQQQDLGTWMSRAVT